VNRIAGGSLACDDKPQPPRHLLGHYTAFVSVSAKIGR
jgi:hypothetical protein